MMKSQTESRKLCFVTWNTNGLKDKISNVLNRMETLQADIAFIQETHIGPTCSEIFKKAEEKNWNVFFTVHSPKSKGVAILIRNKVPFEYICHDEDCSGGYIVLFCHLYGELYTLVNVYHHKADRSVLGRLKDYLRETAEGVLVVGGDFNTVLDPNLDREPSTSRHSPFRAILEDFIVSLNLRDTWSYLHPTEKRFTRRQNESLSRIDMFFLPENRMGRVCEVDVAYDISEKKGISDHCPLVLKLRREEQSQNKLPSVATLLEKQTYIHDNTAGKISGAEILSVIQSLRDSEEQRPDELQVYTYKRFQCSLTEILKIHFNNMFQNKRLYMFFNKYSVSSELRPIFNVDYLIFTQIFANRLGMFIAPSFKGNVKKNLKIMLTLTCRKCKQEIRWSFLEKVLKDLKPIPSAPPPDFTILDCILPKVPSSAELRSLQPGCPLTNTILNLALKHLVDQVFHVKMKCEEAGNLNCKRHKRKCKEIMSMATVSYQRQTVFVHTDSQQYQEVKEKLIKFREESALKINLLGTEFIKS